MKVSIEVDKQLVEAEVIIRTPVVDEEINKLVERINKNDKNIINVNLGNKIILLEPFDIVRIFSGEKKVFVKTNNETYTIKQALYEIEQNLPRNFVRISGSEIINISMVKDFDLSFTGSIFVNFKNGDKTNVSRRFIFAIKEKIGLKN